MKSIVLLPFVLFLFFSGAEAQTQFDQWHKETIYLHSNGYVKEGKKYRRGFFNQKLKKELMDSPAASLEFGKAQKNINTSFLFTVLGLASVIYSANQIEAGNEKRARGFLLGGMALSIGSIPFSLRANNQIHRAVWMHNGDLVIPKEN